ncbi:MULTISPECIES: hypothetical protein [unclassified Sporosarcina]|uniref:hypothetical protein n=1 Tax=unclassified Sporosarcina TaxID=2647733 RepID=UPI001304182B|nr:MULTISPECIES: hypothetical protein [unclassified Sporosarcina]
MKKRKPERTQQERPVQLEQPQRLDNMEFGEEFTFDQKRQQPTNLDNQERRNHRK